MSIYIAKTKNGSIVGALVGPFHGNGSISEEIHLQAEEKAALDGCLVTITSGSLLVKKGFIKELNEKIELESS